MSRYNSNEALGPVAGGLIALVALVLYAIAGNLMCKSQWGDMGNVSWGLLSGCRIELPDGRKMPTSALRDIQLPAPAMPKASEPEGG